MLIELYIKNFALVDELHLNLDSGLNVLTGETGAGKSIIIDALGTVLGGRTSPEMLRKDAEKATIEAVFDISDSIYIKNILNEIGAECSDDLLILSREINQKGRSVCRINHRQTNASAMKDITSYLIDIHGQHEHQSLMSQAAHMDIYDNWCGAEVLKLKSEAGRIYKELTKLAARYEEMQSAKRENMRMLDIYKFESEEIENADLTPSEEAELIIERNRLANAEKLFTLSTDIYNKLSGEESSAIDLLGLAATSADKLTATDESIKEISAEINNSFIACEEAARIIRTYIEEIEISPERLEEVENRLSLISLLKRKYGDTIEEIIAYGENIKAKFEILINTEEIETELINEIEKMEKDFKDISKNLSKIRKEKMTIFQNAIEKELADLAMEKTVFVVNIEPAKPSQTGFDNIEFLISPNPGEPVKPLTKIASGGEISRIMLAIKTVAQSDIPTLIFDEIDAGIGGRTAQSLAQKLDLLASKAQILCITHLAQIASYANRHFSVNKKVVGENTYIEVNILNNEERINELTRMLGSEDSSQIANEHAREMLALASKRKHPIR